MIKPGRMIKLYKTDENNKKVIERYKVIKVYPHIVLCRNEKGFFRSFSMGDLIMLKLIKQSDEIEALRRFVE